MDTVECDRQTDGRTDGQTDGRTDGQTDGWTDRITITKTVQTASHGKNHIYLIAQGHLSLSTDGSKCTMEF